MMQCEKCGAGMDEQEAYCATCGALSFLVRQQTKGKILIPLGKVIPTGIALIVAGLVVGLPGVLLFERLRLLFLVLCILCVFGGGTMLVRYREAVRYFRKTVAQEFLPEPESGQAGCRLCGKALKPGSAYCTLCGTKQKQ